MTMIKLKMNLRFILDTIEDSNQNVEVWYINNNLEVIYIM